MRSSLYARTQPMSRFFSLFIRACIPGRAMFLPDFPGSVKISTSSMPGWVLAYPIIRAFCASMLSKSFPSSCILVLTRAYPTALIVLFSITAPLHAFAYVMPRRGAPGQFNRLAGQNPRADFSLPAVYSCKIYGFDSVYAILHKYKNRNMPANFIEKLHAVSFPRLKI